MTSFTTGWKYTASGASDRSGPVLAGWERRDCVSNCDIGTGTRAKTRKHRAATQGDAA